MSSTDLPRAVRARLPPSRRATPRGCCSTATSPRSRRPRLPRAGCLQRRRHHLPPARLLGPHRAGGARGPRRHRLRLAAALQLPRHLDPQGHQEADRRRHLAAADPHRDRPPPGPRRRRPDPGHPDERRRLGLRVHLRRRGHRPAARRPGRVRHRPGRRLARHRGHAVRAARRARRGRGGPRTPTTSSPSAAAPAPPAERFWTHSRPSVGRLSTAGTTTRESSSAQGRGSCRRRGNIPGTSQAPRPRTPGNSGATG